MIAFIEGRLIQTGTDAVVQVGGLGLQVQLSALTAEKLPPTGHDVRLWAHLVVREDGWFLYGFLDQQEREMFRLLISVSGIGPKVAMNMLSRASAVAIADYLGSGDEKALARLPGIGKKSAARLVVELGCRLQDVSAANGTNPAAGMGGAFADALAVLGAMGMPAVAAENALRRARAENPRLADDLETWVRAALRQI